MTNPIRSCSGAPTSTSCGSSASIPTRIASTPRPPIDAVVAEHGAKTGEELEAAQIRGADGRPHPGDPQLRQGELPGAVRRQGAGAGLHPPGLAARARLSDLQAARLRRLGRRGGPAVPDADERVHDQARRSSSSPSACCRCRRSGTACRTSRSATGSATSI